MSVIGRLPGQIVVDDTKSEASDATIPPPKSTKRVLLEHRERQEKERVEMAELWGEL